MLLLDNGIAGSEVPDEPLTALSCYVGFAVIASLLRLALLVNSTARNWMVARST